MDEGVGSSKGSKDEEGKSVIGPRGAGGVVTWPRAGQCGSGARGRDGNRRPLGRQTGATPAEDMALRLGGAGPGGHDGHAGRA